MHIWHNRDPNMEIFVDICVRRILGYIDIVTYSIALLILIIPCGRWQSEKKRKRNDTRSFSLNLTIDSFSTIAPYNLQ